jgi:O-acetyl-ADP-ribose deacetylase (regulator of RNase III)
MEGFKMKVKSLILAVLTVFSFVLIEAQSDSNSSVGTSATQVKSPKKFQIKGSSVNLVIEQGDIVKSKTEAIVNAANQQLLGGGGVCGSIFKAAGWKNLQIACDKYTESNGIRCPVGEARITSSFDLQKNGIKHIIHVVGPDCRNPEQAIVKESLLKSAYKNSLILAEQDNIKTITFPLISAAIFGYEPKLSAPVTLFAIAEYIKDKPDTQLESIHLVLFDAENFDIVCKAMIKLMPEFYSACD